MLGVLVNTFAIIIGSLIGLVAKKGIKENVSSAVTTAMGLVVIYIGIKGALIGNNSLLILVSLVVGTIGGTIIDIDSYFEKFGNILKKKVLRNKNNKDKLFVEAFVTSSVMFAVGAMTILGSIEAGLNHEYSIFFLKSMLDFVSSIIFASSMGIGVMFSSVVIFVIQGLLTVLATFLKPIAENEALMNEIASCGNIMILAIGINCLSVVKIKVANMLPALLFLPIFFMILDKLM